MAKYNFCVRASGPDNSYVAARVYRTLRVALRAAKRFAEQSDTATVVLNALRADGSEYPVIYAKDKPPAAKA